MTARPALRGRSLRGRRTAGPALFVALLVTLTASPLAEGKGVITKTPPFRYLVETSMNLSTASPCGNLRAPPVTWLRNSATIHWRGSSNAST